LRQVNVDEGGIGWYFLAHLRDSLPPRPGRPIQVTGINAGDAPQDRDRFVNRKAEMYWTARELLEEGRIQGIVDDDTYSQLSTLQYSHDSQGRIRVESKEEARKRGQRSPDRAEGLILAYIPLQVSSFMGPNAGAGRDAGTGARAANPYAGMGAGSGRRMMGLR
jgi:phage terminase large subunit